MVFVQHNFDELFFEISLKAAVTTRLIQHKCVKNQSVLYDICFQETFYYYLIQ